MTKEKLLVKVKKWEQGIDDVINMVVHDEIEKKDLIKMLENISNEMCKENL